MVIMTTAFFRQGLLDQSPLSDLVLYLYFFSLLILFTFGAHGFVMVYHYLRQRGQITVQPSLLETPVVTIQLPIFNELYVVRRLIEAVCHLDYPKDRLEIQVLDDSTDETKDLARAAVDA